VPLPGTLTLARKVALAGGGLAIGATLVDPSSREVVAQDSFERREQAQGSDIVQIVRAFDEALGGVMKDIVLWTVRNPALSRKRRPL